MLRASQELQQEHKTILRIIKIIDKICKTLRAGGDLELIDAQMIIDFIKNFADKLHHGKEEGLYFPALIEAGFSTQSGPVSVMLAEHTEGRTYVSQMQDSISSGEMIKLRFIKAASAYAFLLKNHIDKEDRVLYPMSNGRLSEEKQQELLEKFKQFNDEVTGKDNYKEYYDIIDYLEEKYMK